MSENSKAYKVAGYIFFDPRDYNEAKREAESIEYIRANTDLTDSSKVLKLYNKLVERKTLKTVVGYGFLKELQLIIIKQGIISHDNLPDIYIEAKPVSRKKDKENTELPDPGVLDEYKKQAENYRIKHRNSRIINVFLTLIIIGLILINLFSDHGMISNKEEKLINKYSTWEEKLNAKEKALDDREQSLNLQE